MGVKGPENDDIICLKYLDHAACCPILARLWLPRAKAARAGFKG